MKISVIIPTLNEEACLGETLTSVTRQVGDYEIIVVDGGSVDKTMELAGRSAVVIRSPSGRGRQMNAGAQLATGHVLLFLHADSRLAAGAFAAIREAMTDAQCVGGTFSLQFDQPRRLLRFYAWFTQFHFALFHYGDQGIFVRREVFEQMGGYQEIPIMEDLEFFRRLRRCGRMAILSHPITTSARRFVKHGVVAQQMINTVLVLLYLVGASPRTLRRWYDDVR
ncbi:MAG: TIGR04283 family arsenosugar biosynthesis glycosyltransferase [Acidobacteria bacterium]|nr:TIGR04283 family arsenosugar biosynthesis glycosyltransferase [Acidobacteriota bacterium]